MKIRANLTLSQGRMGGLSGLEGLTRIVYVSFSDQPILNVIVYNLAYTV
jgi:hypothetical protein